MLGGDSRVTRLPSKATVERLRQLLCDVESCRCRQSMFKRLALTFLFGPRKNLVFYSSPILDPGSTLVFLSLFFFFTAKFID